MRRISGHAKLLAVSVLFAAGLHSPACVLAGGIANQRVAIVHPEHRNAIADRGSWISSRAVSGDGNLIVFRSAATNLVADDTNGQEDVFLFDNANNRLTRIIEIRPGDYDILGDAILSGDGRFVLVNASRLVQSGGNSYQSITVLSRFRVDTGESEHFPLESSTFVEAVSENGRYALIHSASETLIPGFSNGSFQYYRLDLDSQVFTAISMIGGGPASGGIYDADLSPDGGFACFVHALGSAGNGVMATDIDAGQVERVDIRSMGVPADDNASRCRIGALGRRVAFISDARNLTNDVYAATDQVFLRDRETGTTELVSRALSGLPSNEAARELAMSGDGEVIAFSSWANDLVGGDLDVNEDVFVRTADAVMQRVTPPRLADSPLSGLQIALSSDGSALVLQALADAISAVPAPFIPWSQIYRHDVLGKSLSRIGESRSGVHPSEVLEARSAAQADDCGVVPTITADGSGVVFQTDDLRTVVEGSSLADAIVFRRMDLDESELISIGLDGAAKNGHSPAISGDGRFVVFLSAAGGLGAGDNPAHSQVYLRDRQERTTTLVSTSAGGEPGNGNSVAAVVSDGGDVVAFVSDATNLIAGDSETGVLLWERGAGTIRRIGHTGGWYASCGVTMSRDGSRIAFSSQANDLVADDDNPDADIFIYHRGDSRLERVSVDIHDDFARYRRPYLSADGFTIAFETHSVSGRVGTKIVVYEIDTGMVDRISPSGFEGARHPTLSGDGERVVFLSNRNLWSQDGDSSAGALVFDRKARIARPMDAEFPDHGRRSSGQVPVLSRDGAFAVYSARTATSNRDQVQGRWALYRADLRIPFSDGFEDALPSQY